MDIFSNFPSGQDIQKSIVQKFGERAEKLIIDATWREERGIPATRPMYIDQVTCDGYFRTVDIFGNCRWWKL